MNASDNSEVLDSFDKTERGNLFFFFATTYSVVN